MPMEFSTTQFFFNIVYIVYMVVKFTCSSLRYISQLLITLSGDIEVNPGPPQSKQCRMLYSNIRGLHKNIKDLAMASRQSDIVFCSETLVSNLRHISELLMPGFKKPILLKRDSIPRALGMAIYVREGFSASRKHTAECGCHEVQVMKVCSKRQNFYLFSIYRNPTLDDSIFDAFYPVWHPYRSLIERQHLFLLVILMHIIMIGMTLVLK